MNWKNLFSKISHAVVPALGAGALVVVSALTGGTAVPVGIAVKAGIGAAVAYLLKPARPAQ